MFTKKFFSAFGCILALSLIPGMANAYVVWSGIYLGTPLVHGRSETIVSSSESHITYVEVANAMGSYWHGTDNGWGNAVNYGTGTIARADIYMLRFNEDWWWITGYHFFLEDDLNTFDDASFATVFW